MGLALVLAVHPAVIVLPNKQTFGTCVGHYTL